jgi:hypothetical protein
MPNSTIDFIDPQFLSARTSESYVQDFRLDVATKFDLEWVGTSASFTFYPAGGADGSITGNIIAEGTGELTLRATLTKSGPGKRKITLTKTIETEAYVLVTKNAPETHLNIE